MNIIIATIKSWNIDNSYKFKKENKDLNIKIITNKEELTYSKAKKFNPEYIFFPHWSWEIPKKIHENYECIVFHMTDLPYGRGGSPLQNLIKRGIENTKISAIKVEESIDTGDIYLKKDLNLNGTAEEIFIRLSNIIFNEMIPEIIKNDIEPHEQNGEVVEFERRTPKQSEIKKDFSLKEIYDHIRMLDAEGYPKGFIEFGEYKLKFKRASLKNDEIIADVEIIRKDKDNE